MGLWSEAHTMQAALLDLAEWNLANLEIAADRKRTSQSDLHRLATIAWRSLRYCQRFVSPETFNTHIPSRTAQRTKDLLADLPSEGEFISRYWK